MDDLIIKRGTVVDGTGAPARVADLAIKDGRIRAIGDCEGPAARTIDAEGLLVTPGFVDIHTHYDGQVSWDADLAPSVYHGVTTCVMSNCGVGFAPVHPEDRDVLVDLMQGVEDIPGTALSEGITWDWESFPQYMDAIDFPHCIDFAVQVPHDALRVYVMRQRALAGEQATPEDIERMGALTREAIAAGAVGFSMGRTDNHRAADGSHTPGSEADVAELVGIARAIESLPHGVLQCVSDFDMTESRKRFDKEYDLIEAMAAAAPSHKTSVSLLQRHRDTEQWRRIVKRTEQAAAKGLDMRLQVGPRGIGVIFGLEATFHPFIGFPSYKKVAHLPLAERAAILRDPAYRAQLLSETTDKLAGDGSPIPPLADELLAHLDFVAMKLWRLPDGFDYEPDTKQSLMAEAIGLGKDPLHHVFDVLLEEGGKRLLYFPIYNYMHGNLDVVKEMLDHPLALFGLSDGGAHVGTICDASTTTYMLTHWARDRAGDQLPLEKVVRMLTGLNAEHAGFADRGTLEVGKKADVNVIDHAGLKLLQPEIIHDLPAGGARLMQKSQGYKATIVSGEVVLEDGELTGNRPGRLVRAGQP